MHCRNSQETKEELIKNILYGEFGIEKESLRVTENGFLADTSHPYMEEEGISRDFSESQLEFISRVYNTIEEACEEICYLQNLVEDKIKKRDTGREYVWTYSNPPLFGEEGSIRIAEFTENTQGKTTYRQYLSEKYGRAKMLYSGVHLNYSLPLSFFRTMKESTGKEIQDLKNAWYLKLADCMMNDSWLIVVLTSASPVAEEGFLRQLGVPYNLWHEFASFRNSEYGYWNLFLPQLCYNTFEAYLSTIQNYVNTGMISSIQELYYPIRLKPKGENSFENLKENGVNHIELRMLDLNPMCCAGVAKKDLIFIHLLLSYRIAQMLDGEGEPVKEREDGERILLHRKAAKLDFLEEQPDYKEKALAVLAGMDKFYYDLKEKKKGYIPRGYDIHEIISFQREKIVNPASRYSTQIIGKYKDDYIYSRMQEIKEK